MSTNDPKAIAAKKEAEFHDLQQLLGDLAFVLDDARGRRVLWAILQQCELERLSTLGGREWTDFNDGKKSIGIKVINLMSKVDVHAWPKLMMEMMSKGKDK
jgi:hypothetical protein